MENKGLENGSPIPSIAVHKKMTVLHIVLKKMYSFDWMALNMNGAGVMRVSTYYKWC